jgi:hypothetical protein
MLLVPPYLNTGGDTYFVAVAGTPGTTINLDSRSITPTDLTFGSSTNFALPAAGYVLYRVQVPVDQIGWQTALSGLSANVDVAIRRDNAASEWFNDAFSEAGGTVGDSVTLVPPVLTDGTYYITLYNAGAAATGTLSSRVPFSAVPDDVAFIGSTLNNEAATTADDNNPTKVGWRYFRVGVADAAGISAQLGKLGWELALSGAPANTEIALRRNFLPGKWQSRNAFNGAGAGSAYYQDFNSATGRLERPGHQADIWYVGVYSATTALGNFSLARNAQTPADVSFSNGSSTVTGQAIGTWRYFKVEVPAEPTVLGWDLRTSGVTQAVGGGLTIQVLRGNLPGDLVGGQYSLRAVWWSDGPATPTSQHFVKSIDANPTASELTQPRLYAGTYYVGVKVSGTSGTASYTLESKAIGTAASTHPIKVAGDLAFAGGSVALTNIAPKSLAIYKVELPENIKSWAVKVTAGSGGEPTLLIRRGKMSEYYYGQTFPDGFNWLGTYSQIELRRAGGELFYSLKPSPTDTTYVAPGTYYVTVVNEGTTAMNATLQSVGEVPVATLGTASTTEIVQAVSLDAAELKFYRFTVAPDTSSLEIRLTERTGDPAMAIAAGEVWPTLYGNIYSIYSADAAYLPSGGVGAIAARAAVADDGNINH